MSRLGSFTSISYPSSPFGSKNFALRCISVYCQKWLRLKNRKKYISYPGKIQTPVISDSLELLWSMVMIVAIISPKRNMLGTVFKREVSIPYFSGVTDNNNIKIPTC